MTTTRKHSPKFKAKVAERSARADPEQLACNIEHPDRPVAQDALDGAELFVGAAEAD